MKHEKRNTSASKNRKHLWLAASCLFFLAGCMPLAEPAKRTFTVELGQDVYGNPALYVKNPDAPLSHVEVGVTTPGVSKKNNRFVSSGLDFLMTGEYEFVLLQNGQQTPFTVKVKDTRPPTPANSVEVVDAWPNQIIDWASVFGATDLSGVYYEAPLDVTSTPGQHPVQVRIYDRFGNSLYKDIVVNVQ